jgi:biofilm PGA synthesis protein PgaA
MLACLLLGAAAVEAETAAQTATLSAGQSTAQRREAAVLQARAGKMAEAQAALRALLAAGADDGLVAMDLATLLQQDGKPAEAVAVFEAAARPDPPDYALLAAVRAYRDLGRAGDAIRLAREGLRRFPGEPVWPLLLSLALSDAGRTAEALEVLRQPAAARAPAIERLMAEAYAWRRAGNPSAALKAYGEAMRLSRGDRGVRNEAAGVLADLGAPWGAAAIAGDSPAIEVGKAGAMVRWGEQIRPPEPARRYDGTDAALARIDVLLATLPPDDRELRRRLRIDRLVALRDRARLKEAAEEGDALAKDAPLPAHAEQAYGDALMGVRRPEEARDAYNRILAVSPRDLQARYGAFFAAVELQDFTTAYALIDGVVADEPVWRHYRNDPTRHDNPERAYAETMAAQARFYGNQPGEAWDRIAPLSEAAPANGTMRLALYQVANARGWPRRAAAEAEIAASLVPRDPGSRMALIEVAMASYRYAEAQRLMDELLALYPDDLAVKRLARELDAKRRWLFEFKMQPSNSDGGGANASGRAIVSEARLYTPPIADNWRGFALGDYSNANPPEGFVQRSRAGAGLEWRSPGLTATIFPTQSWGTLVKAGGGATLDWWMTDHIELSAAAELFSADTPLRGLLYGISADEYAAKATYRWHESRSLSASFAYLPFTDGNQRLAAGLAYREKVVNLPHFDLTARTEAYRLEQHAGQHGALLQSQPGPVADRRAAGRAPAVAALRYQPRAGAVGGCRPLCRARLRQQLDRHAELRAPLALRSAHRAALRRDADAPGLRRLGREYAGPHARPQAEDLSACAGSPVSFSF